MTKRPTPQDRLRYHVSGAIERGEAQPITEIRENTYAEIVQDRLERSAMIWQANAQSDAHHAMHHVALMLQYGPRHPSYEDWQDDALFYQTQARHVAAIAWDRLSSLIEVED